MTAPRDDVIAELQRANAALRVERDAAFLEKAALAEVLAAQTGTLATRNNEYAERIQHQAATIDVLRAMSASPGDPQPVFDLITGRARELCDAALAGLFEYDGAHVHLRSSSASATALSCLFRQRGRAGDELRRPSGNCDGERSSAGRISAASGGTSRVLLNLFSNGFYATRKRQAGVADRNYEPILQVMTRALGDAVEIRVWDNGTGIPLDIKDKLFQPFFTTKPTGEGTGLGLSISYDIITQQHGGTISVESEPGAFTEFTITLPRK